MKDEFYNLNPEQLKKLISKDNLSVPDEVDIFRSVVRWMTVNSHERKKEFSSILKHVRFPLMSDRELEDLLDFPLIKEDPNCVYLIKEAMQLKLHTPSSNDNTSQLDLAFIRPRVPLGLPKVC